jgi:hypothetical protein
MSTDGGGVLMSPAIAAALGLPLKAEPSLRTAERRQRDSLLLVVVLAALALVTAWSALGHERAMAALSAMPYCAAGQTPVFANGFAALAESVGDGMGQPLECEHGDPATGDTVQRTTTGLAWYRPCTNTPAFSSDDATRWALTANGVVSWTDDGGELPTEIAQTCPLDLRRPATVTP